MTKIRSLSLAVLVVALCCAARLHSQTEVTAPFQLSGGYSYLSNSFNGIPGARQALEGWDAAAAFPAWHNLRFKMEVSRYTGTNLGAQQHAIFIMGGGQYEHKLGKERLFGEALFGECGLNRYWGPQASPGETASFTSLLGGGADTPVNRHFALRIEGGFQYTNFALIKAVTNTTPYKVPGLPNYFGRMSAGIVWTPRLNPVASEGRSVARTPPASELYFEDLNSFGHIHIFGNTWWSYLHLAGVEYDRHSWGKFVGARMDYAAEILPVAILKQPSKTDVWGNRLSRTFIDVPGLGIAPIGVRLLWRDDKPLEFYYAVKGGMIAFTQKALSQYASYENFSLHQGVGFQLRLNDRMDLRAGFRDYHFSNGFVVPSNPGIDEMMWNGGVAYRLRGKSER